METRILGRTGLEVAVVGFGAMTIGGIYGPVDDSVSLKALHAAIDLGMNFIDTSIRRQRNSLSCDSISVQKSRSWSRILD